MVKNPATRDLSRLGEVLLSPDWMPPYYRPLNRASYLIDYHLWGMNPLGFHAVNLVLAIGCVLAMYALARRVFDCRAPAFVAAALLAVHPISVEAVAFVTARNNLFALLFALLPLTAFIDASRRDSLRLAWLSGFAFFLGLLSKEPALMVLPLMAALLVLPSLRPRRPDRRSLLLLAPHVAAASVWLALRAIAMSHAAATPELAATPLLQRLALNYSVIPRYLLLILFPRDLSNFHAAPPPGLLSNGWLPLAWLTIAAGLIWLVRHRSVPITVGLLWFAANLFPIAQIVPLPTSTPFAERYIFFSCVGLFPIAAELFRRGQASSHRLLTLGVTAAALLALGARTFARTLDWHDDLALTRSAVAVEPRSARAHFNLGVVLKDRDDLPGAVREWETALTLEPSDAESHAQLGTAAAVRGDFDAAEHHYRAAVASDPMLSLAWFNLGRLLDKTGRFPEAIDCYSTYLESALPDSDPHVAVARERLSVLGAASVARGGVE